MNPRKKPHVNRDPESGAALALVAISMVALLGFAALVVDLGWTFVNRNSLQNISDGASLAATRELGHKYQQLSPPEQATFSCSGTCAEEIRAVARRVSEQNRAGNVAISLLDGDIRIGQWKDGAFTPGEFQPNAVEVTSRRDENINTPITTFFARVLGIETTSVTALATAALTGQSTTQPGELLFPVTLSEYFFEDVDYDPDGNPIERCNETIQFNPTNDPASCGGWTTWDDKSNANLLRQILDGENVSPEMTAGSDRIWTTGGDVGSAFSHMLMLFQRMGCASTNEEYPMERAFLIDPTPNDGDPEWITFEECLTWDEVILDQGPYKAVDRGDNLYMAMPWQEEEGVDTYYPDPDFPNQDDPNAKRYYHMWETTIPVYDYAEGGAAECGNPGSRTQWLVAGFAPVRITDVWGPPDNTIIGRVLCDRYSEYDNRSGGGDYGVKGTIPGLVR